MSEKLSVETEKDVAVITLDDGKANACGFEMFEEINGALDQSLNEAKAVALLGRPGVLSGGFDLKVIQGGDESELKRLIDLGIKTIMRLYGHPQPLVVGATGHAVALGAFILLTADYRIGTEGDFRVGLNETAIGLTLPRFGIELVNERLDPRHASNAAINATLYTPPEAIAVGFLDKTVKQADIRSAVIEKAQQLSELDGPAFATNKASFRQPTIDAVLAEV